MTRKVLSIFLCLSLVASISTFLTACIGDPSPAGFGSSPGSSGSNALELQHEAADAAMALKVKLRHTDFYTLSSPKSDTGCAGDVKTYYSPFDDSAFETSVLDSTGTIKPSFIKNISVDLTDANANLDGNEALSCSVGTGPETPPPSSCATFDYGAIGGIPTSLGGTLLLIGGIQGSNYSGYSASTFRGHSLSCGPTSPSDPVNVCDSAMYAVGIDTLPSSAATDPPNDLVPGLTSASESISSWVNLGLQSENSGPYGAAGASLAYNADLQRLLLFGGGVPVSTTEGDAGADTSDTWTYNLKTQKWSYKSATPYVSNALLSLIDDDDNDNTTDPLQISKSVGPRTVFGYAAVPNLALNGLGTTGTVTSASIDTTERILSVGGLITTGDTVVTGANTHQFNPTFGPEYVNLLGNENPQIAVAATDPVQYLESYHTRLMNNYDSTTYFNDAAGTRSYNFGFARAVSTRGGNGTGQLTGYGVSAGGFDAAFDQSTDLTTGGASGGGLFITDRRNDALNDDENTLSANFLAASNDLDGDHLTPISWSNLEGAPISIPDFGGSVLLPGFDLAANEFAYFGGARCYGYLTDSSVSNCDIGTNAGAYFSLGADLNTPSNIGYTNTAPTRAGMAAARGEDDAGSPIIVAWGGMSGPATTSNTNEIFILWDNAGTPTWLAAPLSPGSGISGSYPVELTNAAMVYSHVTRKFYVFGGYQSAGVQQTVGTTWELTVAGAAGTYTASWRLLDGNGMTCYPNCPTPRRSHKMVEVNYNNTTPTAEPDCTNADTPCSFGIFMEGGTNGSVYFNQRWMFDPTANDGDGHWQRVDGFPPRHFASLANVSYYAPAEGRTVHRAVLFGGETGLHDPGNAVDDETPATQYFVSPTLGDTYIYDFENNSWNRVELLGKGYGSVPAVGTVSEWERRQAFDADTPSPATISELTPPPLSGSVMVVRTQNGPIQGQATPPEQLKIPEIFLFGGRKKDGTYNDLDAVYKFCIGSTGEDFGAGATSECDAFDEDDNPDSLAPSADYVGRWLRKSPAAPATVSAFLSAGAYDTNRDLIVLYGGVSSAASVTDLNAKNASINVLEYTPPTTFGADGSWAEIPPCTVGTAGVDYPEPRYGHSVIYDQLNDQIVITGGFAASNATAANWSLGDALVQTQIDADGDTYQIPDVWAGTRDDANDCYDWVQKTTFGNDENSSPTTPESGLSHAAAVYIPATGYNTGYYSLFDQSCVGAGPIFSGDPQINKLLAGGIDIDLDRTKLGPHENLLLNLTYLPMSTAQRKPSGSPFGVEETAYFKIHLLSTGMNEDEIRQVSQPRYFTYADPEVFPKVVHTLSVLAPQNGAVREDQVLIPLAIDESIDRIRIERYSGSAILIDLSLYRMGYR